MHLSDQWLYLFLTHLFYITMPLCLYSPSNKHGELDTDINSDGCVRDHGFCFTLEQSTRRVPILNPPLLYFFLLWDAGVHPQFSSPVSHGDDRSIKHTKSSTPNLCLYSARHRYRQQITSSMGRTEFSCNDHCPAGSSLYSQELTGPYHLSSVLTFSNVLILCTKLQKGMGGGDYEPSHTLTMEAQNCL